MIVIQGNMLDVKSGVLIHQVNCQGKMGAGIALEIRKKYPEHYRDYMCAYNTGGLRLGAIVKTKINPKLAIVGICSQDRYGRDKRYTDYDAFVTCISKIKSMRDLKPSINYYMPYNIGCANAGGDWKVVRALIEEHVPFVTLYEMRNGYSR